MQLKLSQTFIKRVIKFLNNYLFKNPAYTILYAITFFMKDFSFNKIKFYNSDEVKKEIERGKSLIRVGDGEVHIMLGQNIGFQKYEKEIEGTLTKSIKNYNDSSNYILCINERVMNKSNSHLKKVNQLFLWLPMKIFYFLYFNKNATYFDASYFYNKDSVKNILGEYMLSKKFDKKMILISNEDYILKFKTSFPGLNIEKLYITQNENAYDEINKIREMLSLYKNRKDILVLLSFGPAAKQIAHEYKDFVQCIDIGVGFVTGEIDKSDMLKI